MKSSQFKLMSATAGAGAVLAMGALTVTFSDVSMAEPEPAPPGPVTTSEITTGETATETLAPTEMETTFVSPSVTAEPPEGFEQ